MKLRPTQFGVRENTASPRQHASRLAVDSLPSKSEAIPRGSQHRQPTPVSAYRASESNMSISTMPLEATTGGETGDSDETFSVPAAVVTAKESRQVLLTPEPFVLADEAAQFLCVKRPSCGSSCTHLQSRHSARIRREESRTKRRDAFQVQLPGNHHHPNPDCGNSEVPFLFASLHAGIHLCGDCAPVFGHSGATMCGRALE